MRRDPIMKIEQAIRNKLVNYLAKEMSLRSFWQWFVPTAWDIDHHSPTHLRELVYGIKARVDEYSSGGITEGQLRYELLSFVSSINLVVGDESQPFSKARQEVSTMATIIEFLFSPPKRLCNGKATCNEKDSRATI